jgi:hypothetical protein
MGVQSRDMLQAHQIPLDPPLPKGETRATRHRTSFWLLVIAITVFLSIEPALFLVVLALGLSTVIVWWIVLLACMLVSDAVGGAPGESRCPLSSRKHPILP